MIFHSRHITKLVDEWKETRDPETLGEIIEGSEKLAQVIVSKFPSEYRDDMIQECLARIPYALGHFDKNVSDLHKYLTSVFYNRCINYVNYEKRQRKLAEDLGYLREAVAIDVYDVGEELLEEVTVRNRERFPNVPVDVLDDVSAYILECILDGMSIKGKARGAISHIVDNLGLERHTALVIYHSTLVYLRTRYSAFAMAQDGTPQELSLLPELKAILGDEAFKRLSIIFSGLYFRVP